MLSQEVGRHEKFGELDKLFSIALFHNLGATFLLYTYSMLLDKGKLVKIDRTSLETIALKCTPKLNGTLFSSLKLPNEIVQMYSIEKNTGQSARLISILHKAIFLANFMQESSDELTYTAEVKMEGFDEAFLVKFNDKVGDIRSLINNYIK